MARKRVDEEVAAKRAEYRRIARRLDKLKDKVGSLGKRGLTDTFAIGEALEEAAALLRGGFTGWVHEECGIDPRTALNFRKTFRVLGHRTDWLVEKGIAPSVAVALAAAPPEGRERALAEIEAGRRLTAADAKLLVRVDAAERSKARPVGLKHLKRATREFSAHVLAEASRIIDVAAGTDALDEVGLANLAAAARSLLPLVVVLHRDAARAGCAEMQEFATALDALATAGRPDEVRVAAARIGAVEDTVPEASPEAAPAAVDPVPVPAATRRARIGLVSLTFKHGLTAFELCAGGGGQAAGLAKAGFRHVGLLEPGDGHPDVRLHHAAAQRQSTGIGRERGSQLRGQGPARRVRLSQRLTRTFLRNLRPEQASEKVAWHRAALKLEIGKQGEDLARTYDRGSVQS